MKDYLHFEDGEGLGIDYDHRGEVLKDDITGVTQRAHSIAYYCADLRQVAANLSAVGLQAPADQIRAVVKRIENLAADLPKIVGDELREGIAHSERMMGNMLVLTLKHGDELAAANKGQKPRS